MFTTKVKNIISFFVVSVSATLSSVVPTLCDLKEELCSIENWQDLAIHLGLEQYEVEAIGKEEQVCCILFYTFLCCSTGCTCSSK